MQIYNDMLDVHAMERAWKARLIAAVEGATADKKRSMRDICREAGVGPNYLSQLMTDPDRAPRLDEFFRLTEALGVSAIQILTGVEMSQLDEQILQVVAPMSEEAKKGLLAAFRERLSHELA